ncbi:PREDICTED: uncharacterized protein LOC106819927 [Priapulus caudatus]|uniref:Uncharacterized protein LOC106819927 n=1 Tax=Priapulus caudatus TaxID=37621 RepID=A0ABM1F6B0_PRICU|nr:PREDICTED: uncharacterized protein LOC106819927 [Priapulus caudatus]
MTQEILDAATRSPESFVVVDGNGRVVAGVINFDLENEPPTAFLGMMAPIEAMLVRGEASARREIARRGIAPGRTLHCFVMATDVSLGFAENVRLIGLMEEEMLRLAARGGYAAVLTVNTNRVTQEICKALGYEMYEMVEFCTFEFEGRRPFAGVKPGLGAIGAVKYL